MHVRTRDYTVTKILSTGLKILIFRPLNGLTAYFIRKIHCKMSIQFKQQNKNNKFDFVYGALKNLQSNSICKNFAQMADTILLHLFRDATTK